MDNFHRKKRENRVNQTTEDKLVTISSYFGDDVIPKDVL